VFPSGNFKHERVALGGNVSYNDIIDPLTLQAALGQCYFQVTSNLNMSQRVKVSMKRCYWNINILSLCRLMLLSGNVQSEHVAAEEEFQTSILSEHLHFKPCSPVLLSANFQSEHVAAGEVVQKMILSEH